MCAWAPDTACAEGRRQLAGAGSLPPLCGSRDWTQLIKLGSSTFTRWAVHPAPKLTLLIKCPLLKILIDSKKNSKNNDVQKSKDKKKNSPEPFILWCCVSETQCLMMLTNEWLKAAFPSVRHCLLLLKSNDTDQRAILTLHPVSLGWQSSLHCC